LKVRPAEIARIAAALDRPIVDWRTLAGGFSHETCLLTLLDGQVVARLGGRDPVIEAAVMAVARSQVPVPEVLLVLPETPQARSVMVVEFVGGTPLSDVLADGEGLSGAELSGLGAEAGRIAAAIGSVTLDRPGFFTDDQLSVAQQRPWSHQLAEFAATSMATVPAARLDPATRRAWQDLCAAHAPALTRVDDQARLVHADMNPKNVLVGRPDDGWTIAAVLDWEFAFAGSPYGDAANMVRFGADYPSAYVEGFLTGFAGHQRADLPLAADWLYLGRVLDMFALSDLVTRPLGHQVADQAAELIKVWVADGVPLAGAGRL
jgi:Ser/Thr protein kinase RdoA (MazF antagonist)